MSAACIPTFATMALAFPVESKGDGVPRSSSPRSPKKRGSVAKESEAGQLRSLRELCAAFHPEGEEATQLVMKNTFLEFSQPAGGGLRKSNSSPSLASHGLTEEAWAALDGSTVCSTRSSEESSEDDSDPARGRLSSEDDSTRPVHASSDEDSDLGSDQAIELLPRVAVQTGLAKYGVPRDQDQGASMRMVMQLARQHPLVSGVELVPKKRNVARLFAAACVDGQDLLSELRLALEDAPFVCGSPRLGRKEALIKLRIFDLLPNSSPGEICYNFARKGKCKWQWCKWLHPRTSAAVFCL